MTVEHHILNLEMIANLQDEPERLLLKFSTGHLKLSKTVVEGIVLWMRANEHNGGYYPLELGDVTIRAGRPYKNHHAKHQERLANKLARFKPWFITTKKLIVKPNQFGAGGIVMSEDRPGLRIFRKKNKDYTLEIKQFVKHVEEAK